MKRCPQCHQTYTDETLKFCREDGTLLQVNGSFPTESSDTLSLPAARTSDALPTRLLQSEIAQARETTSPTEAPSNTQTRRLKAASETKQHKHGFLIALSILTLAVLGFGFWYFTGRTANTKQIESIAVLPFENGSDNADAEYLSDGMTESLIGSLSQLPNLSVKARSSVFRYKGKDVELKKIGQDLSVQALLTGRVVQRGKDLTLYIELVDAATEKVLWKSVYNRQMTNLIVLQNEVAQDVANKLRTRLSGTDEQKLAKNYPANAEAYQLYLRGRFHWNKRTEEGVRKGIEYFNRAIELDPNYALAHSGLADSYGILNVFGYGAPQELHPKQKAAALRAVELDPLLAEAHTSLGFAKQLESDFSGSKIEYQRAVELNPNYATAYHWNALNYYAESGMDEQRNALLKRALELDPLSPQINIEYAHSLYVMRKYDEAAAQAKRTLEIDPNYFNAHAQLGLIYSNLGKHQEAIEEMNRVLAVSENAGALAHMAYVQARAGKKEAARRILERLNMQAQREYVHPQFFALIYFGLGDKDQVLLWLNKVCETRVPVLLSHFSPDWEDLLSDPRFARIGQCLNIASYLHKG